MRATLSTASLAQDEIPVNTSTRSNIKSSFFPAKVARLPSGQDRSLPVNGFMPKTVITPAHASVTGNKLMVVYLNSLILEQKSSAQRAVRGGLHRLSCFSARIFKWLVMVLHSERMPARRGREKAYSKKVTAPAAPS
jgi:hypothetical protein